MIDNIPASIGGWAPWSAADIVQFAGAVAVAEMGGPNYSTSMKCKDRGNYFSGL
jgi:hypothetical protein